jgi:hypothetical protein
MFIKFYAANSVRLGSPTLPTLIVPEWLRRLLFRTPLKMHVVLSSSKPNLNAR